MSSNTQKLFNQSFSLSKDPKPTGLHGQQYWTAMQQTKLYWYRTKISSVEGAGNIMEHLMEIMTTGTETFCIVLLLNTFFERKYTSYRFFFPLSAAFLFYLWLPLNTILATSFVTKLFISILIWLVFSQIFYTGALPFPVSYTHLTLPTIRLV